MRLERSMAPRSSSSSSSVASMTSASTPLHRSPPENRRSVVLGASEMPESRRCCDDAFPVSIGSSSSVTPEEREV